VGEAPHSNNLKMKKYTLLLLTLVLFCSHDMYLKFDTYFLQPNTEVTLKLFNGTFEKSDNVIDRNRMTEVSLVGGGQHLHPDTTQWSEQDDMTLLTFKTGQAGTYVAGVSTRARSIELAAEDFNSYLEHDGVLDMLASRKENNTLDQDAVEKYSKHVKAIFQVGDQRSNDWQTNFGYPIEFVPLSNPYHLHEGEPLQVQLLRNGQPLANQLVYANSVGPAHSHEHKHEHADGSSHDHDHDHADGGEATHDHDHEDNGSTDHQHTDGQQLRTDANGIVSVNTDRDGIWYLRTIHLVETEEEGLTHESNWATLTFEVGNRHSHGPDTHTHDEDVAGGIPSSVYWIGSLVLVVGLFFWFNRKKAA
jgi:uncharacterized GH25 family protein